LIALLSLCTPLLSAPTAAPVEAAKDFSGDLFPPDLILREAEALGLTDQQRDAVAALVKEAKQSFAKGQPRLRETTDALANSLKAPSVGEQAALNEFTAMLDAEREIKRAQFLMLLRVKNLLTPSQQEKLHSIVASHPSKGAGKQPPASSEVRHPDAREELNIRLQKVQAGVDRWRSEGRDPAPILELIKTFGDQMQANHLSDAKETLQKALDLLNAGEKPRP
jgi:Spy/CpxP family protein refolding chaperone